MIKKELIKDFAQKLKENNHTFDVQQLEATDVFYYGGMRGFILDYLKRDKEECEELIESVKERVDFLVNAKSPQHRKTIAKVLNTFPYQIDKKMDMVRLVAASPTPEHASCLSELLEVDVLRRYRDLNDAMMMIKEVNVSPSEEHARNAKLIFESTVFESIEEAFAAARLVNESPTEQQAAYARSALTYIKAVNEKIAFGAAKIINLAPTPAYAELTFSVFKVMCTAKIKDTLEAMQIVNEAPSEQRAEEVVEILLNDTRIAKGVALESGRIFNRATNQTQAKYVKAALTDNDLVKEGTSLKIAEVFLESLKDVGPNQDKELSVEEKLDGVIRKMLQPGNEGGH